MTAVRQTSEIGSVTCGKFVADRRWNVHFTIAGPDQDWARRRLDHDTLPRLPQRQA